MMVLTKQARKSLIRDSIVRAIDACGGKAFLKSQQVVPVISGRLRLSGNIIEIPNGTQIQYTEKYASFVERGAAAGIRVVPSYIKRNGTRVNTYSYYSKGQQAQRYIGNPMKESFSTLNDEFDKELKLHFKNVKRI